MKNHLKVIEILTTVLRPNLAINAGFEITSTLLRVIVGLLIIHNGLDKLSNIESFAQAYVEYIGLPFPIFFSYVAAFTESIGGPLLALGLLTRPSSLGLLATMCVAMYHHILVAGFSIPYLELSAIYAACFLFFTINGATSFSIDAWLTGILQNQISREQQQDLAKLYQVSANKRNSDNKELETSVR